MQYLYDEAGRGYLDAFAGIVTISCGHCHPDVVNVAIKQIKRLQHPKCPEILRSVNLVSDYHHLCFVIVV